MLILYDTVYGLCNNTAVINRVTLKSHLKHGVSEEGLQCPLLTVRLGLVLLQQLVEVSVLFAVCQDLQAVLMVPHKLLVDVEHGQQNIKQVRCKEKQKYS